MDWTERICRGLAWIRLVVVVGLTLCMIVITTRGVFDSNGVLAEFSPYARCLIFLLLIVGFSLSGAWLWALLWCCSLLLMPPRFFSKSGTGQKLLKHAPAWLWRVGAIVFILFTLLLGLIDD